MRFDFTFRRIFDIFLRYMMKEQENWKNHLGFILPAEASHFALLQ